MSSEAGGQKKGHSDSCRKGLEATKGHYWTLVATFFINNSSSSSRFEGKEKAGFSRGINARSLTAPGPKMMGGGGTKRGPSQE